MLEAVLSVAIGSYTTQPSLTAATVCVCWMLGTGSVLMDGGRKGGVGAEEQGTGGGVNRGGLGEDRWHNNLAVSCLCANSEGLVPCLVCIWACVSFFVLCSVCLFVFFCNSCAFL